MARDTSTPARGGKHRAEVQTPRQTLVLTVNGERSVVPIDHVDVVRVDVTTKALPLSGYDLKVVVS